MLSRKKSPSAFHAFTLVELLVVIAIIAILMALLLPALKVAKDRALIVSCGANERSIALAIQLYGNDFDDYAVPRQVERPLNVPGIVWPGLPGNVVGGQNNVFCDQPLLGQYTINTDPNYPFGSAAYWGYVQPRSPWHCRADVEFDNPTPSAGTYGHQTSYGFRGNVGFKDVMAENAYVPIANPWDGMWKLATATAPSTMLVTVDSCIERFGPGGSPYILPGNVEPDCYYQGMNWGEGNYNCYYNWSRRHRNGANVAFLDGHVQYYADLLSAYNAGEMKFTHFDP